MLLLIAVLALASTAFLLLRYVKRLDRQVPVQKTISAEPPPNARPLFQQSAEELRLESKEREARNMARREYRAQAKQRELIDSALLAWRENKNVKTTSGLLDAAVKSGLEGAFARAAKEILEDFRADGLSEISAGDLAELLRAHLNSLPAAERASGELFWLKQEISQLLGVGSAAR
jgi:hypothetical protein